MPSKTERTGGRKVKKQEEKAKVKSQFSFLQTVCARSSNTVFKHAGFGTEGSIVVG